MVSRESKKLKILEQLKKLEVVLDIPEAELVEITAIPGIRGAAHNQTRYELQLSMRKRAHTSDRGIAYDYLRSILHLALLSRYVPS